jgi:hypothetical protein
MGFFDVTVKFHQIGKDSGVQQSFVSVDAEAGHGQCSLHRSECFLH